MRRIRQSAEPAPTRSFLPPRRAVLLTALSLAVIVLAVLAMRAWRQSRIDYGRAYRMGYQDLPPFYMKGPDGAAHGFLVDVMSEAARGAGIQLAWTFRENVPGQSLWDGSIEIWPYAFVPRDQVEPAYYSRMWWQTTIVLIHRSTDPPRPAQSPGMRVSHTGADSRAINDVAAKFLPNAVRFPHRTAAEALEAVCKAEVDAAAMTLRMAEALVLVRPAACRDVQLRIQRIPGAVLSFPIAAKPELAPVADALRSEIDRMGGDGKLREIQSRWYVTSDEIGLIEDAVAARRRMWWAVSTALLLVATLVIVLWRNHRANRALRLAEEANAARRASEEHYRLLFESNPQPMWVCSLESHKFLAVNEAAIRSYGYSREEFAAMTAEDLSNSEEEELEEIFSEAPIPKSTRVWRHRRKDGTALDAELSADRIEFRGQPAVLILASDVSERRRLEAELRQSQKMDALGRLAGGIAHDFNNLLTVINGYCELALERQRRGEVLESHIDEIRKAGERAASLTGQLLAFSRKQPVEPTVLDLSGMVSDMEAMLDRLVGEEVRLTVKPPESPVCVRASLGQMQQIVLNLVVNARDAMPRGGALTIEVSAGGAGPGDDSANGSWAVLSVRDTGSGMDSQTRAHIFEPFYTTKGPSNGAGLGLSTVYGIVQRNGGRIEVESKLGQGSTFRVLLPRIVGEPASSAPVSRAPAIARRAATVLIVEDEDSVRALVARILSRAGYTVLVAPDGPAALDLCAEWTNPIDLLITDVVMPGNSGPEVYAQVCRERPSLRAVYMSGYTPERLTSLDVSLVLQKPFTPADLLAKVDEALGDKRRAASN